MNKRTTALLLSLLGLVWLPRVHAAGGWSFPLPPNLVTPDSGRRNGIFYVGEPIKFTLKGDAATRFEVRDYWGTVVDKGAAKSPVSLKAEPPGWYKLYLYGAPGPEPWGASVGGTMFVVFRRDPHFPPPPPKDAPSGSYPSNDEPMRGVTAMGPQRLFVKDASKPDEEITRLDGDVALDKQWYLSHPDPARPRALLVAFPNGTKDLAGVRKIVAHFQNDVEYWEPRNEPNGGSSGTDFANNEMKPFHETVKAVNPKLKVMGPGTVSIGPQLLPWLEDFFKAGGAKYIDVFSFHAYNTINGDVFLARKGLASLHALLAKYGADTKEKWQTEQGYFAAMYGAYLPTHQGRWTMVQMMTYEQNGIPKEHNHLWYDRSHGFWDFPTWWENDDGSLNPAAPLMRVWSEELYGARFVKAYDLGLNGNNLYLGSLFQGPGKSVAAFQSFGSTDGQVVLKVSGGRTLRTVSAFGVAHSLPVKAGQVTLPVPELPVYVEPARGQTIQVVPQNFGANLALAPGVTAQASGTGAHPVDKTIANPITKIINGDYEDWYWSQQKNDQPWMDDTKGFPAWVQITLPRVQTVGRVLVYAAPPWQWQSTLQDYELQYDKDGQWVTLAHVREPLRTLKVFTPVTRTTADSFFSDRWVFAHHFAPVKTQKIRLLVHNTTWGGGATEDIVNAGGQTGPHQIMLREVEVYGR